MPKQPTPVELSEEQVLFFRASRGHLVGPGASNPVLAAQAILGAQDAGLARALDPAIPAPRVLIRRDERPVPIKAGS